MRNIHKKMVLLVITVMSVSFVTLGQNEKSSHGEHQHETPAVEKGSFAKTSVSKEQSQNILTAYLEIKDALVKANGERASTAAAKLVKALGDNQEKLIVDIKLDAKKIEEVKIADNQRDHFKSLSDNVFVLIKSTQGNNAVIYRQYCPMALGNKGASWLSTEKEVYNPYLGDKMLHCGTIKETLTSL